MKKRTKPDLKTCVRDALQYAAWQLEHLSSVDLYGAVAACDMPAKAEIYEDARALAIAYIKKGAEL